MHFQHPRWTMVVALMALLTVLSVATAWAQDTRTLGESEYYGYSGIDLTPLKASVPVRVGDPVTHVSAAAIKAQVRATVLKTLGRPATDVEIIAFDAQGHLILYIGLPGTNYQPSDYDPKPTGRIRLPAEANALFQQRSTALEAAVAQGSATEDDSRGYAVMNDPNARKAALALRGYAVQHTRIILQTLRESGDAGQRTAAAVLLGYAEATPTQVAALVRASRDPDEDVRDEAIRALGVLAGSRLAIGRRIPAAPFIAMLNSGIWTDRNKAAMVLSALSASRDPALLHQIKAHACDSLSEMARWDFGHAATACLILGRIAGMPDAQAIKLAVAGTPEPIISAAAP